MIRLLLSYADDDGCSAREHTRSSTRRLTRRDQRGATIQEELLHPQQRSAKSPQPKRVRHCGRSRHQQQRMQQPRHALLEPQLQPRPFSALIQPMGPVIWLFRVRYEQPQPHQQQQQRVCGRIAEEPTAAEQRRQREVVLQKPHRAAGGTGSG